MPEFFVAVCDDLEGERVQLARMIQTYARNHSITVHLRLFSSGESLLAALRGPDPIHLLFLDIYMPGLSGVETARRIRGANYELSIIFATTSRDHGLESFDNLAFTQGEATAPTEPESTESAEEPAEEPAEVPAEETAPTEPETPAA